MKTNKNEELQSRREFFKSAAKAALPIVGAVVLSQLPMVGNAATGCQIDVCTATCAGTCKGTCSSCSAGCSRTCMSGSYK